MGLRELGSDDYRYEPDYCSVNRCEPGQFVENEYATVYLPIPSRAAVPPGGVRPTSPLADDRDPGISFADAIRNLWPF